MAFVQLLVSVLSALCVVSKGSTAELNTIEYGLEYYRGLSGSIVNSSLELERVSHELGVIASLPETFDAQAKWPYCPSLSEIRDQGGCGSCWAVSSASVMTDRLCISSQGRQQFHFSGEDILSCCTDCYGLSKVGCDGGKTVDVFDYWVNSGVVSGYGYGSGQGCRPYEIPHHRDDIRKTPACTNACQSGYRVPYKADKHYGSKAYVVTQDEDHIRAEIFTNGPVVASFVAYDDFQSYTNQVYRHQWGQSHGMNHAVKIVGWGVENGQKYWKIANSYGASWGKLGGYFKMLRGSNECEIEQHVVTGLPQLY